MGHCRTFGSAYICSREEYFPLQMVDMRYFLYAFFKSTVGSSTEVYTPEDCVRQQLLYLILSSNGSDTGGWLIHYQFKESTDSEFDMIVFILKHQ